MLSFIKTLLQASAWPIQTPEPYSAFHILLCAAGIPLAVFLARRLARTGTHPCGVLFICGLVLAVSELYKQGFLYFVAGQEQGKHGCKIAGSPASQAGHGAVQADEDEHEMP